MTRPLASLSFALLLGASLLAGCPNPPSTDAGDGDGDGDGDIDPESFDSHGCDHMEYGPPVAVTAAASAEDAPMVSSGHRRTDITLVEVQGGNGGIVMFHAHATEPVSVYLSSDVGLTVMQNGAAVTPSDTDPNTQCPDQVATRAVFELEEGMAMFTFGPTAEASVGMVARAAVDDVGEHMHDGGHTHEHDAGHEHEHEHDAGHEHEHDAGHMHETDAGHEHEHDAGHMHETDAGHMHDAG
jgi:hypothetical protein